MHFMIAKKSLATYFWNLHLLVCDMINNLCYMIPKYIMIQETKIQKKQYEKETAQKDRVELCWV